MPAELHAVVAGRLRHLGQRYTGSRRTVVAALLDADGPLTIAELKEHGAGPAQSSLYRNLSVLEDAGVVHRVVTIGGVARYEIAEELSDHHHHLVCRGCGTVEDVPAAPAFERALLRAIAGMDAHRFAVEGHRLDLVGLCARCRRVPATKS